ncbi:MAG: cytochrome C oxidase subunit IV family protein [Gemmatimonadaceae bacterium]|nr:cytochrome C oxidase subunit IV family protein [Gemmatimonadaceae bacterium]
MAHTDAAHAAHGHDAHGHHPTPMEYVKIGGILTAITIWEVWAYYIPSLVASKIFIPMLLILSAVKFAIVVMFYMHLKYDHKLFRALFTGPLLIAMGTVMGLLFLFGKVAIRLAGQG